MAENWFAMPNFRQNVEKNLNRTFYANKTYNFGVKYGLFGSEKCANQHNFSMRLILKIEPIYLLKTWLQRY